MKVFYTDRYSITLPPHHTFPMPKYRMLGERLRQSDWAARLTFIRPHAATHRELSRVHDPNYLERFESGRLTEKEIRRIGLPWSEHLVSRAKHSAGATIDACFAALEDGAAVNLGGGTHHAHADFGQGYCLLNDSAVASGAILAQHPAKKILVLDCDVHQGNGTAALMRSNRSVFTFSIHGENNFPRKKEPGDLDIALPDNTGDQFYAEALANGLKRVKGRFSADLMIYLAGADPFTQDRFGRLNLSKEGLAERDRIVFEFCRQNSLPVAVTMAGGYAPDIDDIVDIHQKTVAAALTYHEEWISNARLS
jgi:acetoin utilization deacetylase AcuC-like enzyme